MKEFVERNQRDPFRRRLLYGEDAAVRNLGAIVGLRWRKEASGRFALSNIFTLLDPDGMIWVQLAGSARTPYL